MLIIRRSKGDGLEEISRDVAANLLRRGDSNLWLHFDTPKEEEIRFLADIKKYSTTLSDDDKKLVLAMIRKMATITPPPVRKVAARRPEY